jgi:Protein of unknown function (DUF2510)
MDLPPSGWYPDPHGTPSLLRWWDGSVWTQHTHPDVSAGGTGNTGDEQAAAVAATGAQAAVVATTAVQAAVHATTVQPVDRRLGAGSAAYQQLDPGRTGGQPSTDWLRRTSPPTGRPTQPQPALPDTVAPTAYQPAVTTVQPGAVQPTTVQPTVVQPGYPQPRPVPAMTRAGGADAAGTQVLFMGDQWQQPVDQWQAAGGPGMPGGPDNRYGYLEAQRRKRRRVIGGITAGTAVAVAAIVVIALNLGGSPPATTADQTQATPAAAATSAAPSVTPTASPSPTTSASPSATVGSLLLSDGQAGLSYAGLPAPWQGAGCPSALNNGAFSWTDGEYAVAGQVNGGSTTWYGEACSGPLPQQYGYTSTAQLQTITENLAGTFANAYYNALQHNTTPEQDQAVSVDGHSGWEVSYDVSYTNAAAQGVTWPDEQAAVVLVDTGTGGPPAVFFTSIPQTLNEGNVGTLVSSLQLISASPAASATGASTATATADVAGGANP